MKRIDKGVYRMVCGGLTAIAVSLFSVLAAANAVPYNPPNRGAPGRSSTVRDAGSRGCGIIVLEPTQTHWGETLQPQPTFWVYVSEPNRTISLTLTQASTDQVLYQATYTDIAQVGISRLPAPVDVPELIVDEPYRWTVSVDCPSEDEADPATTGIVVRRSPSSELTQQLANASPQERIDLLASNGLWYDTLTELGDLRLSNPSSEALLEAWASLLEHDFVQLGDLVNQPLTNCCQITETEPTTPIE